MPHYPFPDFVGKDTQICDFLNVSCLSFQIENPYILKNKRIPYQQFWNYAFIPTNSLHLLPVIGPHDMEVYKVDANLRVMYVRERNRQCENMKFGDPTHAFVIDTNLPVTDVYAADLCGFCTGLISPYTSTKWMSQFYEDLSVGNGPTPFSKHAALGSSGTALYPSSPWPTLGWQSNGEGPHEANNFVHTATNHLLNGHTIGMKEMLTYYQWPARMSVALFFREKLEHESFILSLLKSRIKTFCALYPNEREGIMHKIQGMRWVDTKSLSMWHDYDKEAITACKAANKSGHSTRRRSYVMEYEDEVYWPKDFGKRSKVDIEDISNSTHDL